MSSVSDTKAQIEGAITRFIDEVPALAPLKLIVGLDLRGRGDTQQYRIELPGPKITKDVATDAKVRVEMARAFFNEMAKDAKLADWREAFHYGQAKASGVPQILKLITLVVERQEERARLRRAKPGHITP
ncbi:MAG: hypothetical protein ACR2KV_05495 [Solirubrobacteraceae bacterium]